FRDLPGLALLECGRAHAAAGWNYLTADPVAVVARPSDGADPFAWLRDVLGRLDANAPFAPDARGAAIAPPFVGGLVGYLAYEFGSLLEPRVQPVDADQRLPL